MLDVKHSEAWNREAIAPLVAEDPRRATAIAEGALIRLNCGARCFERYRDHLWGEREGRGRALLELLRAPGRSSAMISSRRRRRPTRGCVARPEKAVARDLRDIFGWSLPFEREVLPDDAVRPAGAKRA